MKYADRSILEASFNVRGACDELITVKDDLITDISVSNVVFYDGSDWFTPANPLLKGTCRNRHVNEGRLFEKDIRPEDISRYTGVKLINALRDPDEEILIPVSEIN